MVRTPRTSARNISPSSGQAVDGAPISVQGGDHLRRSPPRHPPGRFARGKLRLVGEVSPSQNEFTSRDCVPRLRRETPRKSAKHGFSRGG